MNSPETNDPIEKLLREHDHYVPDDGFTKRVMGSIPGRRRVWTRVTYLALLVALAVVAGCFLPWGSLPQLDYSQVLADPKLLSAWLPVAAVLVALGSGLLAALRMD